MSLAFHAACSWASCACRPLTWRSARSGEIRGWVGVGGGWQGEIGDGQGEAEGVGEEMGEVVGEIGGDFGGDRGRSGEIGWKP